ncbi:synaptic vesicle glycoprotein 2A-like [Leguminivora glycinivorella]|uniref:synaptic vesicle glycoprotein 2A-like n=1 Tax=Leguminivora glycinivorella TaxID=1035111 RepID=UPI00200F9F80|nr:synaptic vesicle glycoprotein 2A-like [Leguminivora glycinivorella]XP_048001987.1 synaptic vesicle glycoprotein 2A-like [Leguminivora glycinivorella]
MAEEQACLVRARSDSDSPKSFGSIARTMAYTEDRLTDGTAEPGTVSMTVNPPEPMDNESGELIDYSDTSALDQFHEDALRQAGCGIAQLKVYLACSLALAGATLELSAVPFVLPSCEIELCILPHEKNWLVLISLVGGSLGGAGWGALGARLGRRRALLSALPVNAVFAAVAAFMPTYGTFMMARFCSAIGSGGLVPTCYSYCYEISPRQHRRRLLSILVIAHGVGALLAAALAHAVLPPTGADALLDDKEHFSAWHRYLLLCTLPILASLVSLIWTQESPRYLLDVGREVDAMLVYQSIHSSNQAGWCVAGSAECRPGALQLPPKRPAALHHVRHTVKMFWQAFFQLFSSSYRNATFSLGGLMLFSMAIQFFLASHIPSAVLSIENQQFEASKVIIENATYENRHFNETLENIEYRNVTFNKCSFRDMMLSHVAFRNCSFYDVAFSNIKTSYAYFTGSLFVNTTIIDTDITVGREIDAWSELRNSVIRGMRLACLREAPLTWRLAGALREQAHAALATILAGLFAAIFAPTLALGGRFSPKVILCVICVLLSPSIYIVQSETALYVAEAVYRVFLTLVFYIACVGAVDSYPANLRCCAHGLIMSVAYTGGAIVRGLWALPPAAAAILTAVLATAATACAARLR